MFEKVLLKTDRYSSMIMIYILMFFAGHRRNYVCSDKNLLIVNETFEIRIDLLTHDDMIVVICHVYTTCN